MVVTHDLRPDLGRAAFDRGAAAVVSIGAGAEDYLALVGAALAGGLDLEPGSRADVAERLQLGSEVGLSEREREIIGMIARGLGNLEIASASRISINSIKSYIRSAYHKMGVRSRTQAVGWAAQHGFPLEALPGDADSRTRAGFPIVALRRRRPGPPEGTIGTGQSVPIRSAVTRHQPKKQPRRHG